MTTISRYHTDLPESFVYFDDRGVMQALHSDCTLPSISIACAPSCDLRCPHCIYDAPFRDEPTGLTAEEKIQLLQQASKMGCRYLQICHEGEPTFDSTTLPVLHEATQLGMKCFMFTHGAGITPELAREFYEMGICLGIKCDSLDEKVFNRMIGVPRATDIYVGIQNLLDAGYGDPFTYNGKLHTRLSLVCTVSEVNVHTVRDVARFCWDNKIFFNVARLEKGGRANKLWETMRIKDPYELRDIIDWCSDETGIDYRFAQPDCYCIGACGIQINHNGDSWITKEGCGCDLTEPDGMTYPKTMVIGNVRDDGLEEIVNRVWNYRASVLNRLDYRLTKYTDNLGADTNILAACGGSRTHLLFGAYLTFVKNHHLSASTIAKFEPT